MGWKNIKEAFGIEHQVRVEDGYICIGSGMVHNLITIGVETGELNENPTFRDFLEKHYPEVKSAGTRKLLDLIETPDTFEASIPVFTFQDGDIIECRCEAIGYPNVTHDGRMMYENRFSTDLEQVVRWAKRDLEIWSENLGERAEDLETQRDKVKNELSRVKSKYFKLCFKYPDTGSV